MRLYTSIYKHCGIGSTNNGLSDQTDNCIVIWNESPQQIQQNMPDKFSLVIVEGNIKNTLKAITVNQYLGIDKRWAMFGGNFIYTSDSRFPSNQPIAIHDRYEN